MKSPPQTGNPFLGHFECRHFPVAVAKRQIARCRLTLKLKAEHKHLRVLKQKSGMRVKWQGFAPLQAENGIVKRCDVLQEATKPAVYSSCCTHHVWRVQAVDVIPLEGHHSTGVYPCRPLRPKAIATCGHSSTLTSGVTGLSVHTIDRPLYQNDSAGCRSPMRR